MFKKVDSCRICGNTQLREVLDLGEQVLTGVFPASREQAVTRGPLRLLKCTGGSEACGLLQLAHIYSAEEMFGENYGYRSGLNPSMVAHLRGTVKRILERQPLSKDSVVIDIGSNDSTTLQAYPPQVGALLGVDPTGEKFRKFYPPHITLVPELFPSDSLRELLGGRKASVITSFSMLYDLDRPLEFVRSIAQILDEEGLWVFEQSYMPTMLARNSYDTVCHEHQEYYSLHQIKWLLDKAGLKLVDVEFNDVNGGSFCVTAARRGASHQEGPAVKPAFDREAALGLSTLQPYSEFAARVQATRDALKDFLREARRKGQVVCGLGASTKGNVLLQFCGITEADLPRIGDVNPDKFGVYTPGSLIPIVSEEAVLREDPDYLLVLPWHFRSYFENSPKLSGRRLLFPLPALEVVATR